MHMLAIILKSLSLSEPTLNPLCALSISFAPLPCYKTNQHTPNRASHSRGLAIHRL